MRTSLWARSACSAAPFSRETAPMSSESVTSKYSRFSRSSLESAAPLKDAGWPSPASKWPLMTHDISEESRESTSTKGRSCSSRDSWSTRANSGVTVFAGSAVTGIVFEAIAGARGGEAPRESPGQGGDPLGIGPERAGANDRILRFRVQVEDGRKVEVKAQEPQPFSQDLSDPAGFRDFVDATERSRRRERPDHGVSAASRSPAVGWMIPPSSSMVSRNGAPDGTKERIFSLTSSASWIVFPRLSRKRMMPPTFPSAMALPSGAGNSGPR